MTTTAINRTNGLTTGTYGSYAHPGTRIYSEHGTVPEVWVDADGSVKVHGVTTTRMDLQLATTWFKDVAERLEQELAVQGLAEPAAPQHEVRTMPTAADVLAVAEHHGTAFVEEDGWVNTLIPYPGGSTVVYKAPTGSAVC